MYQASGHSESGDSGVVAFFVSVAVISGALDSESSVAVVVVVFCFLASGRSPVSSILVLLAVVVVVVSTGLASSVLIVF